MQNHLHPEKGHSAVENAGCCSKHEKSSSESGSSQRIPEVKYSFSLSGLCLILLTVYRKYISPCFPPCCRFEPSCSAYAMEAIALHGVFRGLGLTLWRLLRCQPFCKGGYDPVPLPKKKKSQ